MLWDTLDRIWVGGRGSGFRSPLFSFLFWALVSPAWGLPWCSVVILELALSCFRWVYRRARCTWRQEALYRGFSGQWGISAFYPWGLLGSGSSSDGWEASPQMGTSEEGKPPRWAEVLAGPCCRPLIVPVPASGCPLLSHEPQGFGFFRIQVFGNRRKREEAQV